VQEEHGFSAQKGKLSLLVPMRKIYGSDSVPEKVIKILSIIDVIFHSKDNFLRKLNS